MPSQDYRKIKIVENKSQKEFSYDEIVEMMKVCKTQSRLADMLKVHTNTITNLVKSDPLFCEAVKAGKRAYAKPFVDRLEEIAMNGDIAASNTLGAIRYVLNNVEPEEWAEKQKQEIEVKDNALHDYLNRDV
jgi:hypothetical protein